MRGLPIGASSVVSNQFNHIFVLFSGKHRKHPGGHGLAGGQHHHRINFDKYHPGYFGKVGMRHFHRIKHKYVCPIINVESIWGLIGEEARKKYAQSESMSL